MSYELANEKWIDGKGKGLLGQFASGQGYSDLIAAVKGKKYPVLKKLFSAGATSDVEKARGELKKLADDPKTAADVASTAKALRDLAKGQKVVIITDGVY